MKLKCQIKEHAKDAASNYSVPAFAEITGSIVRGTIGKRRAPSTGGVFLRIERRPLGMKLNGEWFCDNCGEKLSDTWLFEKMYGQCICDNCWTVNDILEDWEIQYDGLEQRYGDGESGENQ